MRRHKDDFGKGKFAVMRGDMASIAAPVQLIITEAVDLKCVPALFANACDLGFHPIPRLCHQLSAAHLQNGYVS